MGIVEVGSACLECTEIPTLVRPAAASCCALGEGGRGVWCCHRVLLRGREILKVVEDVEDLPRLYICEPVDWWVHEFLRTLYPKRGI